MNYQDRGDKSTGCAHHWCRRMKRGWTPVRAIVRLQKQVIGYQGSICQTCVSVRRTLALWKPDGREGTSVKGACVSARFKCKTSIRGRDFTFEGQGSRDRNLLQVNTCCFSARITLTKTLCAYTQEIGGRFTDRFLNVVSILLNFIDLVLICKLSGRF